MRLLSQTELFDDSAVTLYIDLLEVPEQVAAVSDHLEKTAAAVVVLLVGLEMLGKSVDAVGEDCDLDLGGSGVALVGFVLLNDGSLFFLGNHFVHLKKLFHRYLRMRRVKTDSALLSASPENAEQSYYSTNGFVCKVFSRYLCFYSSAGGSVSRRRYITSSLNPSRSPRARRISPLSAPYRIYSTGQSRICRFPPGTRR